jgi:hypothetical protein
MSRLLPTQTNASVERSDTPAVLSLDDDATRDVIEALWVVVGWDDIRPEGVVVR